MAERRLRIAVRVTPKSSANRIDGRAEDARGQIYVKLRVSAPPDKGKANEAVMKLLAAAWGLPRSRLRLASGAQSRLKLIEIDGADDGLSARIQAWIDGLKVV